MRYMRGWTSRNIKQGRISPKSFTAEQIIAFLREADVKLSLGRNVGIAFPEDSITRLLNVFITPTSTGCYKQ